MPQRFYLMCGMSRYEVVRRYVSTPVVNRLYLIVVVMPSGRVRREIADARDL